MTLAQSDFPACNGEPQLSTECVFGKVWKLRGIKIDRRRGGHKSHPILEEHFAMVDAAILLRLTLTDAVGDPRDGFSARVYITVEPLRSAGTHPVATFPQKELCLDIVKLAASLAAPGPYYILTCGCGDHGCAGLHQPIDVQHVGTTIVWHIPGGDAGYEVPPTTFVFERADYQSEIVRIVALLGSGRPTSITCHIHNDFVRILAGLERTVSASGSA